MHLPSQERKKQTEADIAPEPNKKQEHSWCDSSELIERILANLFYLMRLPYNEWLFNPYPANVENMVRSYQC